MTPLDPTLTTQAAQQLFLLAANARELVELQESGELDPETADKGVADLQNDLRSIGRRLEEIRKGTRAGWHAEVQALIVADYNASVAS